MRVWIAAGVFVVVLAIAFLAFALHLTERPAPPQATATSSPITDVSATDSYHAGVHTIKGTATVPTACTPLAATTTVAVGTTTIVRVDLSATPDTGICLDMPTPTSFEVTADATSTAEVDVYANGVFATTTP